MATVKILDVQLDKLTNIKHFIDTANTFANRLELHSDKWVVDAKSIMGIFSLDLLKPVELYAEVNSDIGVEELKEAFKVFSV